MFTPHPHQKVICNDVGLHFKPIIVVPDLGVAVREEELRGVSVIRNTGHLRHRAGVSLIRRSRVHERVIISSVEAIDHVRMDGVVPAKCIVENIIGHGKRFRGDLDGQHRLGWTVTSMIMGSDVEMILVAVIMVHTYVNQSGIRCRDGWTGGSVIGGEPRQVR